MNLGEKYKQLFEGKVRSDDSSLLTEALARGLKPLLMIGSKVKWTTMSEDALLDLSDKFEELGDEDADSIASHLNMSIELKQDGYKGDATKKLKQFNKACADALKGKQVKSAFENVNEVESDDANTTGEFDYDYFIKQFDSVQEVIEETEYELLQTLDGLAEDEEVYGLVSDKAEQAANQIRRYINGAEKQLEGIKNLLDRSKRTKAFDA